MRAGTPIKQPIIQRQSLAVTAATTLTADQCGDLLVHNTGATGSVTVTLPAGTARLKVRFLRTAAQTLVIDPNGSEYIKDAAGTSLGAGVSKSLTSAGAYCELEHDGVCWNLVADRPAAVADSITAGMLAAGAVDEAAVLASDVVTTAKILAANVTPPKLIGTGMKAGHFAGRNGAGACTLTGAAVGDRVLVGWKSGDVSDHNTAGEGSCTVLSAFVALFETAITVTDQIQQASATDLSDNKYTVLLIPAAA